jgi:hypothetical protein
MQSDTDKLIAGSISTSTQGWGVTSFITLIIYLAGICNLISSRRDKPKYNHALQIKRDAMMNGLISWDRDLYLNSELHGGR